MSEGTARIAVIQPALRLGEVEENLRRCEDLVRDAHREHSPDVILLPEGIGSPNVFHRALHGAQRPIDGAPMQLLRGLAAELDCVVGGGFVARRGADAYGTYVLAEPDGAAHLHDKDIPTAWENNYYCGGDDDGLTRCETLGVPVGLASGWEWARSRTARRLRGKVELVLGGMCWPSLPFNWGGPMRPWGRREHEAQLQFARELPRQVARMTGAPVAIASHVGAIDGESPLMPGVSWSTAMIGESQICERDGTILARLALEDGEGHVSAEVRLAPPEPLDPVPERFWIPMMTPSIHAAFHLLNLHGSLSYRLRKRRQGHDWQSWPGGDLPDEIPTGEQAQAVGR